MVFCSFYSSLIIIILYLMLHNSNSNQPETSFPEQIKFI